MPDADRRGRADEHDDLNGRGPLGEAPAVMEHRPADEDAGCETKEVVQRGMGADQQIDPAIAQAFQLVRGVASLIISQQVLPAILRF